MQGDMITTDMHRRFCANMRRRRLEINMTQQQLADKLGVAQPGIAAIEAGRASPTLDTVARVAEALDMSPEWLLALEPVGV
jgi:transcriptional regulator with XRE-family HTH domain